LGIRRDPGNIYHADLAPHRASYSSTLTSIVIDSTLKIHQLTQSPNDARWLASDDARRALVSVTLSMAEAGINSSGFAFLHCRDGDEVRSVSFVSELAVSLLQPEAEKTFDPLHRHAPASRQLVLNQRFFDRLASSLSYSDPSPAGRSERSTFGMRTSRCGPNSTPNAATDSLVWNP